MHGTATGTADLVIVQGKEFGNYKTIIFENVSITSTTKTKLLISSTTTVYIMQVDTNGDGIPDFTKTPDDIITKIETIIKKPEPTNFTLKQNYPNLFNPETEIRFQLPENSYVTLKIFNTLGQEIRTLANA